MGKVFSCLSNTKPKVAPEVIQDDKPITKKNNFFPSDDQDISPAKKHNVRPGSNVSSKTLEHSKAQKKKIKQNQVAPESTQEQTQHFDSILKPSTDSKPNKRKKSLFSAIKCGDSARVHEILDVGDKEVINKRGMWDSTPLICACQYRREELALALIKKNAEVNASNEKGCTALHHACLEGLTEIVEALIEKSATIKNKQANLYNKQYDVTRNLDPLCAAATNGHEKILSTLIKKASFNDEEILPAIKEASGNGHSNSVKILLNIFSSDLSIEMLPMKEICSKNYIDTLKVLDEHGVKFKECYEGLTCACSEDNIEIIKLLLDAGLDLKAEQAQDCLFQCFRNASKSSISLLMQSGIDLSIRDDHTGISLKELITNTWGDDLLNN